KTTWRCGRRSCTSRQGSATYCCSARSGALRTARSRNATVYRSALSTNGCRRRLPCSWRNCGIEASTLAMATLRGDDRRTLKDAAAWFTRLNQDYVSEDTIEDFLTWRRDPAHDAAYVEVEARW